MRGVMKVIGRIVLAFAACISLTSCGNMYFKMDNMMKLKKGETAASVLTMLETRPSYLFSVQYQSKEYSVEVYEIIIGTLTSTGTGINGQTTSRTIDRASNYLFLFDQEKKLIYWGFLQEFSKAEDPFIAAIAPPLKEKYYAHLREKYGYIPE